MELVAPILGFVKYILTGMIMYGCFMVVERVRPAEPHQPLVDIWFNLRWYVLYTAIALGLHTLGIGKLVEFLQNNLSAPYIEVPVPSNSVQYGFLALVYFLLSDLSL